MSERASPSIDEPHEGEQANVSDQESTKRTRGFVERTAHRANYVVWEKATRTAVSRWFRRLRPSPPPPVEEVAAAVKASASAVDDVAGVAAAARNVGPVHHRIAHQGVVAGVAGAMAGFTAEALRSYGPVKRGELPAGEYALKIAHSGARAGVAMGGRALGAFSLQELAKSAAKRVGSVGLKRVAGSNVATGVAFATVEQTIDTVHLARGTIDGPEYGKRTFQTAGATGGALGGIAVGAALGSIVPIIGTGVGAVVGGIVGGAGGGIGGRHVGETLFAAKPKDAPESEPPSES